MAFLSAVGLMVVGNFLFSRDRASGVVLFFVGLFVMPAFEYAIR